MRSEVELLLVYGDEILKTLSVLYILFKLFVTLNISTSPIWWDLCKDFIVGSVQFLRPSQNMEINLLANGKMDQAYCVSDLIINLTYTVDRKP